MPPDRVAGAAESGPGPDRFELLGRLERLDPPHLLDSVAWRVGMPVPLRPSLYLPAGARALEIVEWAASDLGCGLRNLAAALADLSLRRVSLLPPPKPPPHVRGDSELLERVRSLLLRDGNRAVGLHGMGGCGKTVLAACAARHPAVADVFADGVFWLSLGESPAVLELQARLAEAAGLPASHFRDERQAEAALRHWFAGKCVLLVLDDVWRSSGVRMWKNILDTGRLLVTTRDARILTDLQAAEVHLDLLGPKASLELLSAWSGHAIESMTGDPVISDVVRRCGGLPLALSVCGALVRDGAWWNDVRDALDAADFAALDRDHPDYAYGTLARSLAAGERFLRAEDPLACERYRELAVFPRGVRVAEAAVAMLWKQTAGLTSGQSRELLGRMARLALLSLEGTPPRRFVAWHDLQHDYLTSRGGNVEAFHRLLLAGYAAECNDDWPRLTDDGYIFAHLAQHLECCGQGEDARTLLLDYRWLDAKLRACGLWSLLADFERAQDEFASQTDAHAAAAIHAALRQASHLLADDPQHLPGQLDARLRQDDPSLRDFRRQIVQHARAPWLRARGDALTPAGGPLVSTLAGQGGAVFSLAVAEESSLVVAGSADGRVNVWDAETGREIASLAGHGDLIRSVAVTPDGRRAISGAEDGSLLVWDLREPRLAMTLSSGPARVTSVAIAANGQTALCASEDGATIVWELKSGTERKRLPQHETPVRALAIAPHGRQAILGDAAGSVRALDLETGATRETLRIPGKAIQAVALSSDGKRALVATRSGRLEMCDMARREHRLLQESGPTIHAVAFAKHERLAAAVAADGMLTIWDVVAARRLGAVLAHAGPVYALRVFGDGVRAVTAGLEGNLKVWDLSAIASGKHQPRSARAITSVAVSADVRTAISGSADGLLQAWDALTGEATILQGERGAVLAAGIMRRDGRLAFVQSAHGKIEGWDLTQARRRVQITRPGGEATTLAMTPDGRTSVAALRTGQLLAWTVPRSRAPRRLAGHDGEVQAIAVMPDGRRAVSIGAFDDMLRVWDLATGREIAAWSHEGDPPLSVAIAEDGRTAVSGSRDGVLRIWDLSWGVSCRLPCRQFDPISAVSLTPDGRFAATGSLAGISHLWSLEERRLVAAFGAEAAIRACAITPDGRTLVAGDDAGRMHFLTLEVGPSPNSLAGTR